MPPSRAPQNKRARRSDPVVADAALESESEAEENEEVCELDSLREEIRDMKISISCIRTGQQDLLSRLAGLERHVMETVHEMKAELSVLTTARTTESTRPLTAMNPTAIKLLDLIQESRTGLKKVVRESIRLHMFSPDGGMYAPDTRQALSGLADLLP